MKQGEKFKNWKPQETNTRSVTYEEWRAEAVKLFGDSPYSWRFVCPACGHSAALQDWVDLKAPEGAHAFSCVGRFRTPEDREKKGGCDYTGGGLFRMNPVKVQFAEGTSSVFEFDRKAAAS